MELFPIFAAESVTTDRNDNDRLEEKHPQAWFDDRGNRQAHGYVAAVCLAGHQRQPIPVNASEDSRSDGYHRQRTG